MRLPVSTTCRSRQSRVVRAAGDIPVGHTHRMLCAYGIAFRSNHLQSLTVEICTNEGELRVAGGKEEI